MDKAVKKAIPDSAKREKIRKAMQWIFEGAPHKDNIYTEAVSIE